MKKYLITGSSYEHKKLYALFSTDEYFICDIGKLKLIPEHTDMDLLILNKLNEPDFKEKLLKSNDNYYNFLTINYDNQTINLSDIKCYKNPMLISYEYEHFVSLIQETIK